MSCALTVITQDFERLEVAQLRFKAYRLVIQKSRTTDMHYTPEIDQVLSMTGSGAAVSAGCFHQLPDA